jgi:hypothetical protein
MARLYGWSLGWRPWCLGTGGSESPHDRVPRTAPGSFRITRCQCPGITEPMGGPPIPSAHPGVAKTLAGRTERACWSAPPWDEEPAIELRLGTRQRGVLPGRQVARSTVEIDFVAAPGELPGLASIHDLSSVLLPLSQLPFVNSSPPPGSRATLCAALPSCCPRWHSGNWRRSPRVPTRRSRECLG